MLIICLVVLLFITIAFFTIMFVVFDDLEENDNKSSERKDFIKNVVDYYHHQKPISLDELQQLFDSVYPEDHIKLNLDDLKVCDMAIKANYYQKVYDYFEMIRKR